MFKKIFLWLYNFSFFHFTDIHFWSVQRYLWFGYVVDLFHVICFHRNGNALSKLLHEITLIKPTDVKSTLSSTIYNQSMYNMTHRFVVSFDSRACSRLFVFWSSKVNCNGLDNQTRCFWASCRDHWDVLYRSIDERH